MSDLKIKLEDLIERVDHIPTDDENFDNEEFKRQVKHVLRSMTEILCDMDSSSKTRSINDIDFVEADIVWDYK